MKIRYVFAFLVLFNVILFSGCFFFDDRPSAHDSRKISEEAADKEGIARLFVQYPIDKRIDMFLYS